MAFHRPEPVLDARDCDVVDHKTPLARAAMRLRHGERLRLIGPYGVSADLLDKLHAQLPEPPRHAPYEARQDHRRVLREAELRLLAPIRGHRVALEGARRIGFLPELYPDLRDFHLPLVQIQELHGAWHRYDQGVPLPVLGHRLHPFYGTYVPRQMEHLELFATWLRQHDGPRWRAVDIGTGCGVLALLMVRAGFEQVLATDINPNALESVHRDLHRLGGAPIDLRLGDLFAVDTDPVDLVVFNPPWSVGDRHGLLDDSLLRSDPDLLPRFFDQLPDRLTRDGRAVILWSNIQSLVRPDLPDPIAQGLADGRLREVETLNRKRKGRKTREKVQLRVLARA